MDKWINYLEVSMKNLLTLSLALMVGIPASLQAATTAPKQPADAGAFVDNGQPGANPEPAQSTTQGILNWFSSLTQNSPTKTTVATHGATFALGLAVMWVLERLIGGDDEDNDDEDNGDSKRAVHDDGLKIDGQCSFAALREIDEANPKKGRAYVQRREGKYKCPYGCKPAKK